jgi:anti-anti-sigma regulatory factor
MHVLTVDIDRSQTMVVPLPESLTVTHATEIRSLLLSALEADQPVELDGRAVSEVDVAGLQVLCAARRSAEARGTPLVFVPGARSAALADAIELAGLGRGAGEAWLREGEVPWPSAS